MSDSGRRSAPKGGGPVDGADAISQAISRSVEQGGIHYHYHTSVVAKNIHGNVGHTEHEGDNTYNTPPPLPLASGSTERKSKDETKPVGKKRSAARGMDRTGPVTAEVKRIFNKHVTENKLTPQQAYALSLLGPQEIAEQVQGLQKYELQQLRDSLRAVRKATARAAGMTLPRPKKKGMGQLNEHPFENHKFKTYEQLAGALPPLSKNLATDHRYYQLQLDKAQKLVKNGPQRESLAFTKELTKNLDVLGKIDSAADEEDKAHEYHISNNESEVLDLQAQLDAKKAHGRYLKARKLMSTGKVRANVYVAKTSLRNIDEAMNVDYEDLAEVSRNNTKWKDEVIHLQRYLKNDNEEGVEMVLEVMEAKGAPNQKMEE